MGDLLPVSAQPSPPIARWLGAAVLAGSVAAIGMAILATRPRSAVPSPGKKAPPSPDSAQPPPAWLVFLPQREEVGGLKHSAALLAASVLADSAVEHYRGAFENPGMAVPLGVAGAVLMMNGASVGSRSAREGVHRTALAAGVAGGGFHVYNLLRRIGGVRWVNLFYGAPLGAPAALSLAGLLGLAADRIEAGQSVLLGLPAGQALAGLAAAGMIGTVGEAWLLHFRGAFHNPFMWAPVALPPVTALALAAAAAVPEHTPAGTVRALLVLTALLGIAGVGFHVYGVGRHMGGWRNWQQNLLDGPPIPAPPSFTALALTGLSAMALIEAERD